MYVFEYIYFTRQNSLINNKCAYRYRKSLGDRTNFKKQMLNGFSCSDI